MKKGRGFLGEKGAESNINIHEWSMHINFFICVLKSVLNELLNRHHVYILFHKKTFSWGASFTEVHQTPSILFGARQAGCGGGARRAM